jgi:hypothetical protein
MKTSRHFIVLALGVAGIAASGLSACQKSEVEGVNDRHGHYAGVGIYIPSAAWSRMVQDQPQASTSTAKLADDEAIIVVTDSQTGEIRACGDLSGYCIGMNPWRAGLAKSQTAPVNLKAQAKAPEAGSDGQQG